VAERGPGPTGQVELAQPMDRAPLPQPPPERAAELAVVDAVDALAVVARFVGAFAHPTSAVSGW
jgi:hypothetical protein